MIDDNTDILEHFGVKGMRWGVRKKDDLVGDKKSPKVSSIKDHPSTKVGGNEGAAVLAIYGGIVISAVVASKIKTYNDSGKRDARKTGDKEFKQNPSLKGKMTVDQLHDKVVKPINPGYGEPGTQMNCRRATLAYEMRRRGNDVKATRSKYATGQTLDGLSSATGLSKKTESDWGEKMISNPRTMQTATAQKKAELVFDALGKNPNGARGELAVGWVFGGGHSMAYEIVGRKPVIFDTQNGKSYRSAAEFSAFTPTIYEAAQTRLDNKPINDKFIKRWVTDV